MKKSSKILSLIMAVCMLLSVSVLADEAPADKVKNTPVGENENKLVEAAVTGARTTWIDADGTEVAEGTDGATAYTTESYGQFGYFSGGEEQDYEFRAAMFYDINGLNEERSVLAAVNGGTYDDSSASGIEISSTTSDFNSIIAVGDGTPGSVNLEFNNISISALTDSDGSDVSDFTGLGAALYASEGATVVLNDSTIETTGVAKVALMVDDYAAVLVNNSYVHTQGGTLYDSYLSTANQAVMVAPPWVLGIQGNARSANVEGQSGVLAVYNSEIVSGSWGILSVDAGSNMTVFALDSVLTLDNSNEFYADDPFVTDEPKNGMTENYGTGYCSYGIGSPREWFLGSTINVGTYAICITGGYATYASSNGTFDVYATDKDAEKEDFLGNSVVGLATEPVFTGLEGAGNITQINSDGFGFMFHGNGGVYVTEGTVVNTDEAVFLIKTSGTTCTVDQNSQLNTANGILYQMMDNDDSAVGMDSSLGTQVFKTSYSEATGWPSANEGGVKGSGGTKYNYFNLEGTEATGNIYNGTGYYGSANALAVTLGIDAVLNGSIAATEIIHADEFYTTDMTAEEALSCQKTDFPAEQYYYINRVANRIFYNGFNNIDVTLTDNAVWNVSGVSVICSLNVADTATVNGDIYEHEGFLVVVPAGEADPYAGLDSTPAYTDGENTDYSAIGTIAAAEKNVSPAAENAGFDMTIRVNGNEFETVHIGVEKNGNTFVFQLGDFLDALGITLSYDEETGIATVTANDAGMLAALLGLQGDTAEDASEQAEEPVAAEEPALVKDEEIPTDGKKDAGIPTEAAPAETVPVEATVSSTDEGAYQEYLCAFVDSCEDIQTSGAAQEFKDAILSGDYVSFPVEMLFDATWFGETAMTYDEFIAANGNYSVVDHPSNGAMLDGTGE